MERGYVRVIPSIAFCTSYPNPPLFIYLFIFFLLSLYRNQRDFQESLTLNVLNVDARLEFASENGTGIERLHSELFVQEEGVYTELFPEAMMLIILKANLKLTNMSLIKEGTIVCALLPFFKLFSCSSRCLFSALYLSLRLYIATLTHLDCGLWTKKNVHIISVWFFYPFTIIIHQILFIHFCPYLFDQGVFRNGGWRGLIWK